MQISFVQISFVQISRVISRAVIFLVEVFLAATVADAQNQLPRAAESLRLQSNSVTFEVPTMWEYSAPLISPEIRDREPSRAQKDPTVVFHDGKWHVFMTVKLPGRSAIEYCSFEKWDDANDSARTILRVSDSDYYCAPQVFYFAPHEKWYLIYQMGVPGANKMWVAYSTTSDIADPGSWTWAQPILDGGPNDPRPVGGLDYWIICDDQRAFLFLYQPQRQDVAAVDEPGGVPHGI